ncbi:amidohydrolase family protein [Mariniblastus fucicola]|uniref:Aminodeoxyfutalosine deaminase n=1 Tax=Mariniblastus fucicola TaxID=980251 RepID=A0A5B9PE96_9BACT|nr:amidohydrolase family protein [Mariniblastus fucicola]QEG23480.1 Aminodeoxyfutalosine deaminase [Mariniblastus fucicola]
MPSVRVICANWILPVSSPPIRNGAVAITADQIVAVGDRVSVLDTLSTTGSDLAVEEHPHATIIPGLINAHTHLEFSHLQAPLGHKGISLPDWIAHVMGVRGETDADSKRDSIQSGLKELYETGTVAVGEISTFPTTAVADYSIDACQFHIHKTLFLEQLTRNLELLPQRGAEAAAHLNQRCIGLGLSPHAPYSTHPDLLKQIVDLAIERNAPLAMHVAETKEELELLESRSGKFVELLQKLGVWKADSFGDKDSIDNIIEQLGRHNRSMLVHGNYLNDRQLQRISELKITVVFCPRTHAWFGHDQYPLARMLELGINVAIGTDSRASNPDLNLLEELRLISQTHPNVLPETILSLGTRCGAIALGVDQRFGTLEIGKGSAIGVIDSDKDEHDPWWWLTGKQAASVLR